MSLSIMRTNLDFKESNSRACVSATMDHGLEVEIKCQLKPETFGLRSDTTIHLSSKDAMELTRVINNTHWMYEDMKREDV